MQKKELICNSCGKRIVSESGIIRENVCEVTQEWGYFSILYGEVHSFTLCESCYDEIIKKFKLPVTIREKTEWMTESYHVSSLTMETDGAWEE